MSIKDEVDSILDEEPGIDRDWRAVNARLQERGIEAGESTIHSYMREWRNKHTDVASARCYRCTMVDTPDNRLMRDWRDLVEPGCDGQRRMVCEWCAVERNGWAVSEWLMAGRPEAWMVEEAAEF